MFLNITDMYVFEYLRFNFKTQDFVMRLPIKAQIITQKLDWLVDVHGYINSDLNFETVICQ